MAPPSEKLAGSLGVLRSLQERGVVAVRAADLPERTASGSSGTGSCCRS